MSMYGRIHAFEIQILTKSILHPNMALVLQIVVHQSTKCHHRVLCKTIFLLLKTTSLPSNSTRKKTNVGLRNDINDRIKNPVSLC